MWGSESFTCFLCLEGIHIPYATVSLVKASHMIVTDSKGMHVPKERRTEEKS